MTHWPSNNPAFEFPSLMLVWAIYAYAKYCEQKTQKSDQTQHDSGTLSLIHRTSRFTRLSAVLIGFFVTPIFAGKYAYYWYILSCILMIFGQYIRNIGIITLGINFTRSITIPTSLTTAGIYKIIRHPGYLGGLIFNIGFGFSFGNYYSGLIVFIPMAIVMIIRIISEEKVLYRKFGDEYVNYKKRTWALIPFIY